MKEAELVATKVEWVLNQPLIEPALKRVQDELSLNQYLWVLRVLNRKGDTPVRRRIYVDQEFATLGTGTRESIRKRIGEVNVDQIAAYYEQKEPRDR